MLRPSNIKDYTNQYHPEWICMMPEGCPPMDIMIPYEHPFYRLARRSDTYGPEDFLSYAEKDPKRDWGEQMPLAVGLSVIDNESKARKNLKLPMFKQFKGIIALMLNPTDGVVKQTGIHHSHYTWWRTKSFEMSNLKMLEL